MSSSLAAPGESVEPVTVQAPRLRGPQLLHQFWADVVFLHWPVEAERVAPLLPAGVRPDVHAGSSWVGLVHFRMRKLGFGRTPALPWLGDFAETNVRLYSVDAQGRRGVVFRCLDADRALPVLAARGVAALPYNWAPTRFTRRGQELRYRTRRRWPGPRGAFSDTSIRVGAAIAEPDALQQFLTARWALHTTRLGWRGHYPVRWPNEHPTWTLHRAEVLELEENLVAVSGLPDVTTAAPASVLYSPGLPVRFGAWQRVPPDVS